MKDTIIIKGFYQGVDKPTIKEGDRIWLELNKKDLITNYTYYRGIAIMGNNPYMSLLSYVREKVHTIFFTGSLYN